MIRVGYQRYIYKVCTGLEVICEVWISVLRDATRFTVLKTIRTGWFCVFMVFKIALDGSAISWLLSPGFHIGLMNCHQDSWFCWFPLVVADRRVRGACIRVEQRGPTPSSREWNEPYSSHLPQTAFIGQPSCPLHRYTSLIFNLEH